MQNDARTRVIIMGAAGRDFHNFNVVFRQDPLVRVVAFTAAQIPDIAGRTYPPVLSGPLYPSGIPIVDESELVPMIRRERIDWVYFSYSDISHQDVMHKASTVLAAGASFGFLGPERTAIRSRKPVISVCAVRTGVGKSSATRRIARFFLERDRKVSVIRHPMPYGNLEAQRVQRFGDMDDLIRHEATVEEREEYEPLLRMGMAVFAGVDYLPVLHRAEEEADLVIWDGGNNDLPFLKSDLHLVLVDPHRPGDETNYHPGEANLRMADVVLINKADSATASQLEQVRSSVAAVVSESVPVLLADSVISVADPEQIRGKKVLVVGDGPTLTHGGMAFGAGTIAAQKMGAAEIVPGRRFAVGSIEAAYQAYPHMESEVPALGYSPAQLADLEATLNAAEADLVLFATPVDLARLVSVNKPMAAVEYEFRERGAELSEILADFDLRRLVGR
ncbi:MAG: GTPase [Chloroflexi bacterium]|nr:GTPase [Chloroflexota bacterium]MDA1272006.1 GTPase [Chloroflexota bacterium]PKB59197.1 MAG: GTPase [SAR202 cluster bacterium Casp-Chloro-G2]